MNVSKIRTLSRHHATLKEFHEMCSHNDAELAVRVVTTSKPLFVLGSPITQSIIDKVRKAVGEEIEMLEMEIKEVAARG